MIKDGEHKAMEAEAGDESEQENKSSRLHVASSMSSFCQWGIVNSKYKRCNC